jgi:hypothetical protein
MTGSTTPSLSSEILNLLAQMQQMDQASGTSGSSSLSPSSLTMSSLTMSSLSLSSTNPLQQLFSAMDTNDDGSVSESEMESYVEGVGGTQSQADSLYSALNQGGTNGLTQSDFATAAPQAPQGAGGHHAHHHGMSANSSDQVANTLLQAIDGDDDSADGGTATGAGTSTNASIGITALGGASTNFAQAWETLQNQSVAQSSSMISMLDTLTKLGTTASAGGGITA